MPGVKGPYILHVGGDQWYKNREGVVAIHEALGEMRFANKTGDGRAGA